MSGLRHTDILIELVELCHERLTEVRQQLVYFRASVYKNETAAQITATIAQLRLLCGLFGDDLLSEVFCDDEAMAQATEVPGQGNYVPGECAFSCRIARLLASLNAHFERIGRLVASKTLTTSAESLTESIRQNRQALLAICAHGTRRWEMFDTV